MERKEEKYLINKNKINLIKEDWKYLIILDACRYDYFKEIYNHYINKGKLKKAISPGIHTIDWLNKVFTDFYEDIIYVSGNIFVNSKRVPKGRFGSFNGKKHFPKIIDVWDTGWNKKLGTVPPKEVNNTFLKIKDKKKYKNKRFILHYIQPHTPYISKNYVSYISKEHFKRKKKVAKNLGNIKKIIEPLLLRIIGTGNIWKLLKFLYGGPTSQACAIYFEEGWSGIRKAYKENLELVLESVKKLLKHLDDGKIIITSDHGEFLGEYGLFTHIHKIRKSENTEVPWLEIKK